MIDTTFDVVAYLCNVKILEWLKIAPKTKVYFRNRVE